MENNEVLAEMQSTSMSPAEIRGFILGVQARLERMPGAFKGDNDMCPLKHTFVNGIYVREIFIPKGMLIVGKLHKHAHPNFLLSGDVSMLTEEGAKRIQGPVAMVSPAGTKRLLYAHTDLVWCTVHSNPDNKSNLDEVEDDIIAKDYESLPNTDKEFIRIMEKEKICDIIINERN